MAGVEHDDQPAIVGCRSGAAGPPPRAPPIRAVRAGRPCREIRLARRDPGASRSMAPVPSVAIPASVTSIGAGQFQHQPRPARPERRPRAGRRPVDGRRHVPRRRSSPPRACPGSARGGPSSTRTRHGTGCDIASVTSTPPPTARIDEPSASNRASAERSCAARAGATTQAATADQQHIPRRPASQSGDRPCRALNPASRPP